MLQLEKDLLEIQLNISKMIPFVNKILYPMYGYNKCDYLVSDSHTYLNTDYIPNRETVLYIKFKISSTDNISICCSDNFGIDVVNGKLCYMYGDTIKETEYSIEEDTEYTIQLSKQGLYCNDEKVIDKSETTNKFESTKSLLLGAHYNDANIEILGDKTIYYCVIQDADEFANTDETDGNLVMSVLNQVNLEEKEYTEMGGTDEEISAVLDEIMNKTAQKSSLKVTLRDYYPVQLNEKIEKDSSFGFLDKANRKFYKATDGEYTGLVTNKYFKNKGTGVFTAGPVKIGG